MTPSTDGGGMGNLEHHIWALPRHRATESLWKRWLMVSPGSRPKRRALLLLLLLLLLQSLSKVSKLHIHVQLIVIIKA